MRSRYSLAMARHAPADATASPSSFLPMAFAGDQREKSECKRLPRTRSTLRSRATPSMTWPFEYPVGRYPGTLSQTKNFHWHVSGAHFRDYHLLLDDQAAQIFAMSDAIADRVRKI